MKKMFLLSLLVSLGFSMELEIVGSGNYVLNNGTIVGTPFYVEKEDNKITITSPSSGSNSIVVNGVVYKSEKETPSVKEFVIGDIDSLIVSGSNKIVSNNLKTDKLEVSISGSSKINFNNLKVNSFNLESNGSSIIYLKDTNIDIANINLSGSSVVDGLNTKINKQNKILTGSSSVNIF